jgi:hypothetical protein
VCALLNCASSLRRDVDGPSNSIEVTKIRKCEPIKQDWQYPIVVIPTRSKESEILTSVLAECSQRVTMQLSDRSKWLARTFHITIRMC